MQFITTVGYAELVSGVYDPDQSICFLKVISPVGSDRLLSTHIPDVKLVAARWSVVASRKQEILIPLKIDGLDNKT